MPYTLKIIPMNNDSNGHVTNISVLLTADDQVIGLTGRVADSVTCFTLIMSVIIEREILESQGGIVSGQSDSILRIQDHVVLHPLNVLNISTGSAG